MSHSMHVCVVLYFCAFLAAGSAQTTFADDPSETLTKALDFELDEISPPTSEELPVKEVAAEAAGAVCGSQGSCCACRSVCCCVPCCDNFCTVSAGVAFLNRSNSTNVTLITDQITGDEVLNTGDLDFDYRAAPWLSLTRQYNNCWGWDVGYIGLDSWHDTQERGGRMSPVLRLPQGIPVPTTGPNDILATTYGTDFHSFHLNLRHRARDCVTLVGGFRWIELGELLEVRQIEPVSRDLFSVDTDNHLYGFQLGTDLDLLYRSRWSLVATTRAGVFYNRADQVTLAPVLTGIQGVVDNVSAKDDHTAFVGELGVEGQYSVTSRISLTAGYRLYWLEGVALAPNQLRTTDLNAPGSATVDTGGSLFLDGATFGVNVTF